VLCGQFSASDLNCSPAKLSKNSAIENNFVRTFPARQRILNHTVTLLSNAVLAPGWPVVMVNTPPGPSTLAANQLSCVTPEPDALLTPDEESACILAAQRGDQAATASLVNAYWNRLYRWLYQLTRNRHQAEDLVQETFLKVLANLRSFKAGTNFRAWLFRIGHNNFVNLKRSGRRVHNQLPEELPSDDVGTVEAAIADQEVVRHVAEAIDQLTPEFRSAILLRAEQDMSFREIAAVLNITEETARWRVFKARQRLVSALNPELLPASFSDGEPTK
jgi:RNA polymerase sigma-70 factor, ECF subfamily